MSNLSRDLLSAHLNSLHQTLGAVEAQVASVKNVIALIQQQPGEAPAPAAAPMAFGGAPAAAASNPFGGFGQPAPAAAAPAASNPFGSFGAPAPAPAATPAAPDPKEELNEAMKNACKYVLEKAGGKMTGPEARKAVTDAIVKKFGVKNMKALTVDKYGEAIAFIKASMV